MARTPAEDRAIKKYEQEKIDKVLVRFPKGEKQFLQEHAVKQGESVNAFIRRAVREAMERDNKEDN